MTPGQRGRALALRWASALLAAGLGLSVAEAEAAPAVPSAGTAAAVTAQVLVAGEPRGSAIFLGRGHGGSWLVTSRHVVDGEGRICIRTSDGRDRPATAVLSGQDRQLDVAFLWLPGSDRLPAAIPAAAVGSAGEPWDFPIVVASGYPVGDRQLRPPYRERRGLLLPLLPGPLEGGMQLATTAAVHKGMSGGGLFDEQGRLIGLNTSHADPLWPAPLKLEGGKALSPELNRRLELVALAIPASRFLPLLATLQPPGQSPVAAEATDRSWWRGAARPPSGGRPGSDQAGAAPCAGSLR